MTEVLKAVFWLSALLVVYAYAGYPLLLGILAGLIPRKKQRPASSDFPSVTLIISAYNESGVIAQKLENALALDYPKDRLEILVVSDCSDDRTDDIVRSYACRGTRLIRQTSRLGKTAGLNLGVPQASGSVLVFSDANALYEPDAIRRLVAHFADPRVGYVVGSAKYREHGQVSASAESEGLYWKLETWLKKKESDFYSVIGGDGAIYAIRRELYFPLRSTDINDFLNPLQIVVRGFLGVFEPAAISHEEAAESFQKEFRRKVRIIGRSLNAVRRVPQILKPWRAPRHWFLLLSHKILRWFGPFLLMAALLSSLLLWAEPLYRTAAWLQLAFYTLALLGWGLGERRSIWLVFYLPYYFCLMNIASLLGVINCFRGTLSPTWQTVRQGPARRRVA